MVDLHVDTAALERFNRGPLALNLSALLHTYLNFFFLKSINQIPFNKSVRKSIATISFMPKHGSIYCNGFDQTVARQ
jgi:hypothetical protein